MGSSPRKLFKVTAGGKKAHTVGVAGIKNGTTHYAVGNVIGAADVQSEMALKVPAGVSITAAKVG